VTYCLGMLLKDGLIMMADTRTNASIDNFSSFRKLHTLVDAPGRQIFACTSGNLSMSQAVISLIQEGLPEPDGSKMTRTLNGATSMFRAAQLVGEAVGIASSSVGSALAALNLSGSISLLLGGRIDGGAPALFHVYSAGNFIECKSEVPFLQIGETKYGRPILDRCVDHDTSIEEALKIGFLSFDSAMRSNLGVARPLDILVMRSDPKKPLVRHRIEREDVYFNDLSMRWSRLLQEGTRSIPNPPFIADQG
jgi:putative proteasome-type protease